MRQTLRELVSGTPAKLKGWKAADGKVSIDVYFGRSLLDYRTVRINSGEHHSWEDAAAVIRKKWDAGIGVNSLGNALPLPLYVG